MACPPALLVRVNHLTNTPSDAGTVSLMHAVARCARALIGEEGAARAEDLNHLVDEIVATAFGLDATDQVVVANRTVRC
jgi:hypothetical protein